MNTLSTLLQLLSGKKTYLTALATGVLLFGNWQHWWQIPSEVYLALMAAAVAFLRAGVAKGPDDPPASDTAPATAAAASSAPKIPLMMLAFACLAMVAIIGCQSTPQTIAYQSAGTAVVSVDTAMNLWGAYVAASHPSTNVELQVENAYEKYQAAVAVACDAGAAYAAASVTNSTTAAQMSLALQQATSTAGQDLTDLENLITSLGVKLQ